MGFDKILKKLISESGKTQAEICRDINISTARFNNYVIGKRQPDFETLSILANYFNVTSDYLLGKTNIKYTPEMLEAYKKGMEIRKRQEQERIDTSKLSFGLSADDLEHLTEEQKNAIKILAEGFIKENYKKGK